MDDMNESIIRVALSLLTLVTGIGVSVFYLMTGNGRQAVLIGAITASVTHVILVGWPGLIYAAYAFFVYFLYLAAVS